jgi:hypothetical protein
MTDVRGTTEHALALAAPSPDARGATEHGLVLAAGSPAALGAHVHALALLSILPPAAATTQMAAYVLAPSALEGAARLRWGVTLQG